MAIPHYTYLVLKMPRPAGVITLRGDVKKAYECDRENCDMADVMEASLELAKELQAAAESSRELDLPTPKNAKTDIQPEGALTQTMQLDPEDPTKVTHIGTQLDPK